jgi:hypothetical protein
LELINKVDAIYRDLYNTTNSVNELRKKYNSEKNNAERISLFNQMQLLLDGTPSFRKNEDGTSYLDNKIEKSRKNPEKYLAGDIFIKLEEFYKLYDYYFKDDSEYVSSGLKYDQLSSG